MSHAVDRMLQRKISTAGVELVVNEPDGTINQSHDKFTCYKEIKRRKDNLMAIKSKNAIEVLTVMIDFEVQ